MNKNILQENMRRFHTKNLNEETAKTYTTKKSWTLKCTHWMKHWREDIDVMLQIPAGTVWKQLANNTAGHEVIQTTTPLLIKTTMPKREGYAYSGKETYVKQPVKAVYTMHGILGELTPEFHIFIPISPELFPPGLRDAMPSYLQNNKPVYGEDHIDMNSDNNAHAADLFSNLEHTFMG